MTDLIDQFISQHQSNEVLKPYLEKLAELKQQWLSPDQIDCRESQQP